MIKPIDRLLHLNHSPPEAIKSWLFHNSSLTEKLKTESGEAKLQVLSQNWIRPNWWEKFTFEIAVESVIHRDILMFSQNLPCWFGRTIIPHDTFQANRFFFDRLSNESIGLIIFNEPKIKRDLLHAYSIDKGFLEYQWLPESLKNGNEQFWLRLSVFSLPDEHCFYLVEILLPGLMRVKEQCALISD
ncbi:MAG: chorismate lyase [Tatlockia sp.]|nr:chorismate lyase [Tatlockia sp.]